MKNHEYLHGYSKKEGLRLNNQAATLEDLIHYDSIFPRHGLVLEAGCGVGAQTKIIASKNPDSCFISIDISQDSITEAERVIRFLGISNVEFKQADICKLPFRDGMFDCVIICFVLEHLQNPLQALTELKRVLRKGGTMMVIEGDHGSTFFYPDSNYAYLSINCQIQLQKQSGGNANIGRELYLLLNTLNLSNLSISPRIVYVDSSKPQLVEGFIKNTFISMIEGVKEKAIQKGIIDNLTFEKGINDLYRTTQSDGIFCYTFFKGCGIKK